MGLARRSLSGVATSPRHWSGPYGPHTLKVGSYYKFLILLHLQHKFTDIRPTCKKSNASHFFQGRPTVLARWCCRSSLLGLASHHATSSRRVAAESISYRPARRALGRRMRAAPITITITITIEQDATYIYTPPCGRRRTYMYIHIYGGANDVRWEVRGEGGEGFEGCRECWFVRANGREFSKGGRFFQTGN